MWSLKYFIYIKQNICKIQKGLQLCQEQQQAALVAANGKKNKHMISIKLQLKHGRRLIQLSQGGRTDLSLNHGGLLSHETFRLQLRRHFVDVPQTRLIGLQVLDQTKEQTCSVRHYMYKQSQQMQSVAKRVVGERRSWGQLRKQCQKSFTEFY